MSNPVAIILTNHSVTQGFNTVFGVKEVASLNIAGLTIIEHILMELQDLQIKQCFILANDGAEHMQSLVGNEKRWGMDIQVMKYSINKEQVLREFKPLADPDGLLVIEADKLRGHTLQQFLDKTKQTDFNLHNAVSNGIDLGITLLKYCNADFIINSMPIELDGVSVCAMNSLRDFHRANFSLIEGKFQGLAPSVQKYKNTGRLQHWESFVHRDCTLHSSVMIGGQCRVGKNASLTSVVLNEGVFVEKNAILKNAIVMPKSSIPTYQVIENAIVSNNVAYQI
jgi:NDP-sugar pyrophosphorylase family protein